MPDLFPYPFAKLLRRMFRELDTADAIFDMPRKKFFLGSAAHDFSVRFHGHRASSPLGPAAGPQSQMAQNLVLCWLGGSRIMELKTVQIMDELEIPRPCIDMRNVGYNVEWSQELTLEQSLDEYVKGAMLIQILQASGKLDVVAGFDDVIYDMSVGYDLKGISSPTVRAFIEGMMDASDVVDRLRAEIPDEFAEFRDLDFTTKLADTLTLSTFHGCPPDEIQSIIEFLMQEYNLHCIVKLNPTLLGSDAIDALLHDALGYTHIHVPPAAFEKDTTWPQAETMIEQLSALARTLHIGFGVKLTNTLIVEHDGDFLGAAPDKYLSGQPLHVLAMTLVQRIRERFGPELPISFSAGIERANVADAAALGLCPITVCSDLLRPGGYARQCTYFAELMKRMDAVGAGNLDAFIGSAHGHDGSRPDAILHNTTHYVSTIADNPRYAHAANTKTPKKIGSTLELFNCITCDKCVPVCPNDANFTLTMPQLEVPILKLKHIEGKWTTAEMGSLVLDQKHQIANFADFCNECGNCDIFCPEDGGPYVLKPRFFGSLEAWSMFPALDGFFMERVDEETHIHGRFDGLAYELTYDAERATYKGDGFDVSFLVANPAGSIAGTCEDDVDLTYYHIMVLLAHAVFDTTDVNYISV